MIQCIPNQPVNFCEPLILPGDCELEYIPITVRPEDELIFQVRHSPCEDADTFLENTVFQAGWTTKGVWEYTLPNSMCAESGQDGDVDLIYAGFSPVIGTAYTMVLEVESISGSITVEIGGHSEVISNTGETQFTFSASSTSSLVISLTDENSSVCLSFAQVYAATTIGVTITDCEGGDLFSAEMQENPQYFTYRGANIIVRIPFGDMGLSAQRCFRVEVSDLCDPASTLESITRFSLDDNCKGTYVLRTCMDEQALGFEPGFFEVRLPCSVTAPKWATQVEQKRDTAGKMKTSFAERETRLNLNIKVVDHALHPYLSALTLFDHLYIHDREYVVTSTSYDPLWQEESGRMGLGTAEVEVAPKSENARRTKCQEEQDGCHPNEDPICNIPDVAFYPMIDEGSYYVEVVIASELGFIPTGIEWAIEGVDQTPVTYTGPGSFELGPVPSDSNVSVTLTNADEECDYTEDLFVPFTCGRPTISNLQLVEDAEGEPPSFTVQFNATSSDDFPIVEGTTAMEVNVDGDGWEPDSVAGVDGLYGVTYDCGQTVQLRLVNHLNGCVYNIHDGTGNFVFTYNCPE